MVNKRGGNAPAIKVIGRRPKGFYVKLSECFVDRDTYQRSERGHIIKKFNGTFNWNKVGAITLAPRGRGGFAIVDGAHRSRLAAEAGIDSLPATVLATTTVQDEADAFVGINQSRGQVTPNEVLRALAVAGDHGALDILRIVERVGLKFGDSGNKSLACGSTLMQCFDNYGPKALEKALKVILSAWGGVSVSLTGPFVGGMTRLLFAVSPNDVDTRAFIAKLARQDPHTMRSQLPNYGDGLAHKHSLAFLRFYNRQRRTRVSEEALAVNGRGKVN